MDEKLLYVLAWIFLTCSAPEVAEEIPRQKAIANSGRIATRAEAVAGVLALLVCLNLPAMVLWGLLDVPLAWHVIIVLGTGLSAPTFRRSQILRTKISWLVPVVISSVLWWSFLSRR